MVFLMFTQLLRDLGCWCKGIFHRFHRPVVQLQHFFPAAALTVRLRRVFRQRTHKAGAVRNQRSTHNAKPLVKIRQHLQKRGLLLTIPQNPCLVFI